MTMFANVKARVVDHYVHIHVCSLTVLYQSLLLNNKQDRPTVNYRTHIAQPVRVQDPNKLLADLLKCAFLIEVFVFYQFTQEAIYFTEKITNEPTSFCMNLYNESLLKPSI